MKPIISVKGLEKTFRTHERGEGFTAALKSLVARKYITKRALKGVSFDIEKGEIIGLIGPNGAGKSTCIKALTGVLYPDEGEVECLGFNPWKQRIKYVKNIGVVFGQKSSLWWDLPAIDTFALNREVYGVPKKDYKKRLDYMLKLLKVEDISKTPVRKMSLGERMKCEVIAALLHNPKIVFFDEPTIGMDAIAKERLRSFVYKINKEYGTTFILTTHNIDEVEHLCERVIIINEGSIVYDGAFKKIKNKYIDSKYLDIKFEVKPGKLKLPKHAEVVSKSGAEAQIKVNINKQKIHDVVEYLVSKFQIADITISEPPIDRIIGAIYEEEK